jgi:hypothetical protein
MTTKTESERAFPPLLAALHDLPWDYADGDGMDFDPYREFMSAAETTEWIRAWTANRDLTGDEFRVFGQDGTGGLAAFWLVRPGKAILDQPIVFLGSEGDAGVVALNFADYLWLLAAGVGPLEAIVLQGEARKPVPHFQQFARSHATTEKSSPKDILAAAAAEFPRFDEDLRARCR